MSLCSVSLIGNIGREVELRYTPKGVAVAEFSVAVNDKNGDEKITNWFKIILFGSQAEYFGKDGTKLQKGEQCFVSGKLQFRPYDDKSGTPRISYEVLADTVQSFGKSEKADKPAEKPKPANKPVEDDSEIPF